MRVNWSGREAIFLTPCENQEIKYLKSAAVPISKLNSNRYESDLSNEVLCSLVAQRTEELLTIKVGGLKQKWSYLTPVPTFSS